MRTLLGLCASLRAGSYNAALLRAATELAPTGTRLVVADLRGVPEFDEDLEARGTLERVEAIKREVAAADALLFAVAEYNYGLPGWFKNVIDWVSRPQLTTPLRHKPTGVVSASLGERGGARAQMALRQTLVYTDTYVMPRPELFVGKAATKFDARARLVDEPTRRELMAYLQALLAWADLVGG